MKADVGPKPEEHNIESGHEDLELSMSDTPGSQTHLNLTSDYSSVRLNNCNVEERRLSAKGEDPLEGPSWRFQSVGTSTRRERRNSKPLHSSQSNKKVITIKPV